jgi:hypothetical protein
VNDLKEFIAPEIHLPVSEFSILEQDAEVPGDDLLCHRHSLEFTIVETHKTFKFFTAWAELEYRLAAAATVGDATKAMAERLQTPPGRIQFHLEGEPVSDAAICLSDLPQLSVTTLIKIAFSLDGSVQEVEVFGNTTVAELGNKISDLIGQPHILLFSGDDRLADDEIVDCLAPTGCIRVQRVVLLPPAKTDPDSASSSLMASLKLSTSMKRPLAPPPPDPAVADSGGVPRTFEYQKREIALKLSLDATFTDVKALLAPQIGDGIPFDILWDDVLLDDDMTIGDIEECEYFIVSLRAPPPVVSSNATYTLYYYVGDILSPIHLPAQSGATLADIEVIVKSIAQLTDVGTEFVLRVGTSTNPVAKTTRLDCPDLKAGKLIIRRLSLAVRELKMAYLSGQIPWTATLTVSAAASIRDLELEIRSKFKLGARRIGFALLNEDCEIEKRLPLDTVIGDVFAAPGRMLGIVEEASTGPAAPAKVVDATPKTATAIPFKFRLMEDDAEAFTLYFEPEQRIGDARAEVGRVLGEDKDFISLFLRGGALKDGLLLGRLRIKEAEISVSVRKLTEVLLRSAFALRESYRPGRSPAPAPASSPS